MIFLFNDSVDRVLFHSLLVDVHDLVSRLYTLATNLDYLSSDSFLDMFFFSLGIECSC